MNKNKIIKIGQPSGSGCFSMATKEIRVLEPLVSNIYAFIEFRSHALPLYTSKIKAGFPSPADDHIEKHLDLNTHLIKHPAATFFLRVSGNSMINAGIFDNDLLIVDRSINPIHGKIVIAVVNGELTVKRLHKSNNECLLIAENPEYPSISISADCDLHIWGVVTKVIHDV